MNKFIFLLCAICLFSACAQTKHNEAPMAASKDSKDMADKIAKTDEEWKTELSEQEYYVLRQKGTERAFTGDLWDNHEEGVYTCAACSAPLFLSETKFESGTGWPSFYKPASNDCIKENVDTDHGMVRTEVVCGKCGGHLGHKFPDGPKPTGMRYCINSVSLNFEKK